MIAVLLVLALWLDTPGLVQTAETVHTPTQFAHVNNTFRFEAAAPLARVAPLFGPEGERCWAGKHWDPQFVYPQPARDLEGAVFTVRHGEHHSVWVNTIFDLAGGRMQYVMVIPEVLVSLIDVRLKDMGATHTAVEVTYARTALATVANDGVQAMGASDRDSGPDWQRSVGACLAVQQAH
jgi:hypothetical protein